MAGDRAFLMAARFRVRMAEMGLRRAFEVFVLTDDRWQPRPYSSESSPVRD